MKLHDLIFGEFLDRDNPFSAEREPRSHEMFSDENNRLLTAWSRTAPALPGAVLVALVAGPFYRWVGAEPGLVSVMTALVALLPFLVLGYGLATGIPAFWTRRYLIRDADKLRTMEHDLESKIKQHRRV